MVDNARRVVYLARHGETEANLAHRYAGRGTEGLTPRGRLQAEALSQAISGRGVGDIWTSDVNRARETAQLLARRLGVAVKVDARLTELNMGPWEGLTESEVARRYPAEYRLWLERPDELEIAGRETLLEVAERVHAAVAEASAHPDPILLVTHVAPVRVAVLRTLGLPLRLYKRVRVENTDCFEIFHLLREVRRMSSSASLRGELVASP
jgi:broad specificity phosphatase PhoE